MANKLFQSIVCALFLISGIAVASDGNEVPININFVSTKLIDDAGAFRVIDLNDEIEPFDPCFLVQHFENGLSSGVTNTVKICSAATNVGTIDARDDSSGGTWFENFTWGDTDLQFILESAKGVFDCNVGLSKGSDYTAICILKKGLKKSSGKRGKRTHDK